MSFYFYIKGKLMDGNLKQKIYSGTVKLENGKALIDIDASENLADGTFESTSENVRLQLTNADTFDTVKVLDRTKVPSGKFTIFTLNATSNALIDWLVIVDKKSSQVTQLREKDEASKLYEIRQKYLEELRQKIKIRS